MKFVIEHLSKRFEKKEVLRDIDFAFEEGKIYGLLGRNGAGKTTLFNCLNNTAHIYVVYLVCRNACSFKGVFNNDSAEINGGSCAERASPLSLIPI